MQYRVLDVVKHQLDVLRVDGCGVVVEQGLAPLAAARVENAEQKRLDVLKVVGVTLEIWKVVGDFEAGNLIFQQVHLVQEEDDRNGHKAAVVDDGFKDVG